MYNLFWQTHPSPEAVLQVRHICSELKQAAIVFLLYMCFLYKMPVSVGVEDAERGKSRGVIPGHQAAEQASESVGTVCHHWPSKV